MDRRSTAALVFGGVIVAAVAAWLTHAFYQKVPEASFDGGPFGVWLTILSTAALLFGAWHALQTFRHSQEAEVAGRFQKAAELLSADKEATIIAGIAILHSAARAAPPTYTAPAIETLIMLATSRAISEASGSGFFDYEGNVSPTFSWPRSNVATAGVFTAIGRLANIPSLWPSEFVRHGRLHISPIYLAEKIIAVDLRNCRLERMLLNRVIFEGCDFTDTELEGSAGQMITFHDCRLKGAKLVFREHQGVGDGELADRDAFDFVNCHDIETATFNGVPLPEWPAQRNARAAARKLVRGISTSDRK